MRRLNDLNILFFVRKFMHVVKQKNKRSPYSNLNNQKFVNKGNSNKNINGMKNFHIFIAYYIDL